MTDPGGKEWRLAKRTTGRKQEDDSWVEFELEFDPNLKVGSAGPKLRWDAPRKAGITRVGRFAAAVVALAVVALVLNFTLPWFYAGFDFSDEGFEGDEPRGYDRDEVLEDSFTYQERLVNWPLVSFIVLTIAGLGLLGTDMTPGISRGVHLIGHGFLLWVVAFFGFLLALTGTRWLGLYITHLLGDPTFTFPDGTQFTFVFALHAVPYINLVVGLGVLAGAIYFLKPTLAAVFRLFAVEPSSGSHALRLAALSTIVCAGGLLLMPLLPFASGETVTISDYLSEASFAAFAQDADMEEDDLAGAGSMVGLFRGMVWVLLYLSMAVFWVSAGQRLLRRPEDGRALVHVYALGVVPLALAVVFLIRFYVAVDDFDGLSIFANPFLPLSVVALVAVYGYYVVRVLLPFLRTVQPSAQPDA